MAISKHVLFCVLLLVGILLASCEPDTRRLSRPPPPPPSPPPPPPPPPPGPLPGYDYFKLALQWPNSYCSGGKQNYCDPPVPPQQFTIRGLWPLKGGGITAPTCCSTAKQPTDEELESLKDELVSYWPRLQSKNDWERSRKLWYAQWRTYGSCSSDKINPKEYFKKATDLAAKYSPLILSKLKEKGINPGGSYPSQDILDAIKIATGFKAVIRCSKDNSARIQLLEIHLCVEKEGVKLQNCFEKAISCDSKNTIFPSAPPTPPPPPPLTPPPPPSPNAPWFDYFMLSLQWPNALCKEVPCKPTVPRQYFTIHGLWPQRAEGSSPQNCATNEQMTDFILEEFQCELLEYWPRLYTADEFDKSKRLWIEQWNKHGTCSSNKFPPEAYLQTAIDLGKKFGPLILSKLKEKGIEPDGTTRRTTKQILDAIKEATKKGARISCNKDTDENVQLSEIRICFEADGETLRDCKSTSTKDLCSEGFIFPSAPTPPTPPPPPPRLTHFPSFVSSILEVEEAVKL